MALGGLSTCRGLASHVSHLSQTHQSGLGAEEFVMAKFLNIQFKQ
jgi:hypothetical protein